VKVYAESKALRKLARNSQYPWGAIAWNRTLIMPHPSIPPPAFSDIEESELKDMLITIIDARCGLSAIHQLLDGTPTMAEIRVRYDRWKASQHLCD